MKFNSRVGREEPTGPMTLEDDDIVAVIKLLVDLRNGKGEIDDIDHLGNRRVRCVASWPRTSSVPVWCVSSAPCASVWARPRPRTCCRMT